MKIDAIAKEHVAQIFSIIEINRSVIQEMAAKEDEINDRLTDRILDQLSPDERKEYAAYLREVGRGLLDVTEEAQGGKGVINKSVEFADRNAGHAVMHLLLEMSSRRLAEPRGQLLRKSLLVTAISTFEVLFGQIAKAIYAVNTASLNDSEYRFTLQEMADFPSLEDAREYLAEKKVAALLRDSVDAWEKWIKRAAGGISMETLPVSWPIIREAFARRNLIVHTGGVTNHLYAEAVRKLKLPKPVEIPIGVKVTVDEDYLDRVAQELLALGLILSCAVGSKLYKESGLFARTAEEAVRDLAGKQVWYACSAVSSYALSCRPKRADQLRLQVRQWLARRETEGLDSVRAEIENWDTSGLDQSISHYKYLLLEDTEKSVAEVRSLISANKLSRFELAFDPIYKGVIDQFGPEGGPQEG
jgi:hypothetical protein